MWSVAPYTNKKPAVVEFTQPALKKQDFPRFECDRQGFEQTFAFQMCSMGSFSDEYVK